ncbi:MAG: MgtC/SapB family protein [Anaerolineae bacterium]
MFITPDDLFKLALAIIIGGAIGLEREVHNKSAGLRTIILICVGATLITVVSLRFGDSRVAANIVSGVGFLGAGVIMREEGRVRGLTTASTIWVAAALGLTIGYGEYVLAAVFGGTVIVVLWLFTHLDKWIDRAATEPRTYDIVHADREGKFEEIESVIKHYKINVFQHRRYKRDGALHVEWDTRGTLDNHDQLTTALLADPDVLELRY